MCFFFLFENFVHCVLFDKSSHYSRIYSFDKRMIIGLIEVLLGGSSSEEINENHVAAPSEYNPRAALVYHHVPCNYVR